MEEKRTMQDTKKPLLDEEMQRANRIPKAIVIFCQITAVRNQSATISQWKLSHHFSLYRYQIAQPDEEISKWKSE